MRKPHSKWQPFLQHSLTHRSHVSVWTSAAYKYMNLSKWHTDDYICADCSLAYVGYFWTLSFLNCAFNVKLLIPEMMDISANQLFYSPKNFKKFYYLAWKKKHFYPLFILAETPSLLWKWRLHLLFYHLKFQHVILLLQLEDSILSSQHRHFQIHSLLWGRAVWARCRRGAGGSQFIARGLEASAKLQGQGIWDVSEGNIWFGGWSGCGGVCVILQLRQRLFVWECLPLHVLTSIFITTERKTTSNTECFFCIWEKLHDETPTLDLEAI